MRLVHLTDPHLVAPPGRLFGLDPLAGLRAALDHVARHQTAANLVVLTGDLTDRGEAAAYAALREELARLPQPVVLLLGNHDDRPAFRAAFPEAPVDGAGFVQQVVDDAGGSSLVALDTHVPGAAHGELCAARLAWLDAALDERRDRTVVVAMHHPPVPCGLPGMDAIGLQGAAAFWSLVQHHGNVRHVLAGHIHRTFFARHGAVTLSTLPGTSHQVHFQPLAEGTLVLGSHEPAAYALASFGAEGCALHNVAYADRSPRFVFDDASNAAANPADLTPVPPHLL